MRTNAFISQGEDKAIVIGCDNTSTLSSILNRMRNLKGYNCITVTRISDLISAVNSAQPVLIILCYQNSQVVINNVCSFLKSPKIPMLCLTNKFENDTLTWDINRIVLTQPLRDSMKGNYLITRVNSILMLIERALKKKKMQTFAQNALGRKSDSSNTSLSRYVLELDQKVETLLRIKDRIKELYADVNDPIRHKLMSIVNSIKASTTDRNLWNDFRIYFENINPKFLDNLFQKHPELTLKDIRYCCYLKMNMSNNEITHILGINQESVRTHKYRLKKKLAVPKEQNLHRYIKSFA